MAVIFKKLSVKKVDEVVVPPVTFSAGVFFDEDGCLNIPSPIWSVRKAPIPVGLVIPEEGLKVKVHWKDVDGKLVFPGIHIVSKKEYEEADSATRYNDHPVKLVDCRMWIEVTRKVMD